MEVIKKTIRFFKRAIQLLLFFIVGYLLFAAVLSFIGTHPQKFDCQQVKHVFISTNGVHLDIVFPKKWLDKEFLEQLNLNEGTEFVSFGWGNKEFYLNTPEWKDLKLRTAINSAFFNCETAVHLTMYRSRQNGWIEVKLCESQFEKLTSYLEETFQKNTFGELVEIEGAGYSVHDKFFEATGNYNLFHTSNEWVNQGLKKADVKTSIWSPFDYGVLYHVKLKRNHQD